MSSDPDTQRTTWLPAEIGRARRTVAPPFVTFGRNVQAMRAFLAKRRRDRRFAVQPYGFLPVANAAVVAVTAFVLLVIMLDDHLVSWHQSLPDDLTGFFKFFTQFGKADWILIITGCAVILALFTDIAAQRRRRHVHDAVRAMAAAYVFLAVAVSGIIANLAKHTLGRARPKLYGETGSFGFDFWSWDSDWASLPSGHATTGMALGVSLALLFPRLSWVFLCLGFWIAASRPLVGVHYPSDMLAGCLLGGVTAWLIARAFARVRLVFGFDEAGRLERRKGASGRFA